MAQTLRAMTFHVVTRRRSALALGGGILAARGAFPGVSTARKKKSKSCKKQETQRCNTDAAACKNTVALGCAPGDPTDCAAEKACCDTCSANGFITCLLLVNT
jgi:hypothetical protein